MASDHRPAARGADTANAPKVINRLPATRFFKALKNSCIASYPCACSQFARRRAACTTVCLTTSLRVPKASVVKEGETIGAWALNTWSNLVGVTPAFGAWAPTATISSSSSSCRTSSDGCLGLPTCSSSGAVQGPARLGIWCSMSETACNLALFRAGHQLIQSKSPLQAWVSSLDLMDAPYWPPSTDGRSSGFVPQDTHEPEFMTPGRQAIQRVPSSEGPPPGTTQ